MTGSFSCSHWTRFPALPWSPSRVISAATASFSNCHFCSVLFGDGVGALGTVVTVSLGIEAPGSGVRGGQLGEGDTALFRRGHRRHLSGGSAESPSRGCGRGREPGHAIFQPPRLTSSVRNKPPAHAGRVAAAIGFTGSSGSYPESAPPVAYPPESLYGTSL